MQFYTRKRRAPFINIVSLVDILAILLIFSLSPRISEKTNPS